MRADSNLIVLDLQMTEKGQPVCSNRKRNTVIVGHTFTYSLLNRTTLEPNMAAAVCSSTKYNLDGVTIHVRDMAGTSLEHGGDMDPWPRIKFEFNSE